MFLSVALLDSARAADGRRVSQEDGIFRRHTTSIV
jgi:hypothetical protein